ncbi:YybH family protein [Paenirhodobacter sp.]|uniref:YybH family protein n=1 Tax=Paenirhodobacter sp. TaxID=1965326 RepID=UPI003B3EC86D
MRKSLILAAVVAMMPTVSTVSWAQAPEATPVAAADEQAIRDIRTRWATLIEAGDAAAIEQLYGANAVLMAPGEDEVVGSAAIGARWGRQLQLEGFSFRLNPEDLIISSSGDLAYDRGTYDFAATIPQVGPITDTGKYVLVWQKISGDWKVISDIFNSDPAPEAN